MAGTSNPTPQLFATSLRNAPEDEKFGNDSHVRQKTGRVRLDILAAIEVWFDRLAESGVSTPF
jgi:hypothetical protein